jgi:hypothetical protein
VNREAATRIVEKQNVDAFIDHIIVTLLIQIGSLLQRPNEKVTRETKGCC